MVFWGYILWLVYILWGYVYNQIYTEDICQIFWGCSSADSAGGSDPNATNRLGHPLLGICTSACGVELLVKHAADVNKLSILRRRGEMVGRMLKLEWLDVI